MKKSIGALFVSATLLNGVSFAADPPLIPHQTEIATFSLSATEPIFDFGSRDTTESVQHVFIVKNATNSPVPISDVKTSCGCTATKVSQKIVPPGGTSEITMTLDLWGMRGYIKKPIVIISEGKPVLTLAMQGSVTRALEVLPQQLNLGEIQQEGSETRTIVIVTTTEKSIRVTNVTATTPMLECKIEELSAGNAYAIRVTPRPERGVFEIQGQIRILLDYPANPVIDVPVTAKVINDIEVIPPRIIIGGIGADASPRYIVVRGRSKLDFELNAGAGELAASVEHSKTPEGYRVTVTPKTKWQDLHDMSLELNTNISGMEKIQIPITVTDMDR